MSPKMNYVTREIMGSFDRSTADLCNMFCRVMEYDLDIYEYSFMSSQILYGFILFPSKMSSESSVKIDRFTRRSDMHRSIGSVEDSIGIAIDTLLAEFGETRTSLRMKAQLMGVSP